MRRAEVVKILILIVIPFVLISVIFIISRGLIIKKAIAEEERRIYGYLSEVSEVPDIPEIPSLNIPTVIKDPFSIIERVIRKIQKEKPPRKVIERRYTWDLKLIVMGRKKKFALLNNILVKEGDYIDEFLVKEIGYNYVVLKKGERIEKVFIKTGG
jgi:hypothetical protein